MAEMDALKDLKKKKGKHPGGYIPTELSIGTCPEIDVRQEKQYLQTLSKLVAYDELKQSKTQYEIELTEKHEKIQELETDVDNLEKTITELKQTIDEMEKEKLEMSTKQEEEDRAKEKEKQEHEMYDPDFKQIPKEVRSVMQGIKEIADKDNSFCDASNAMQWSAKEVAYWLELINFSDYIPGFLKQRIDGEILISDMDKQILTTELGVLSSHAAKILRQVQKLRSSIPSIYTQSECVDVFFKPERNTSKELELLENELKEKEAELEELRGKPQVPEDHRIIKNSEFDELNENIETKTKQVETLENELETLKSETDGERVKLTAKIESLESDLQDIQDRAIPEQEKQEKLAAEQAYLQSLKDQKESNPMFASEMRIKEWSIDEVCCWLHSIGMSQYFQKFKDNSVTGRILINDIGENQLESYFNIKAMHRPQVLRELDELKIKAFGRLDVEENIAEFTHVPEERAYDLIETIAQLEAKINEITQNYEESKEDAGAKQGNISELTDEIAQLKEQIEKLEFDMSQEEWIS